MLINVCEFISHFILVAECDVCGAEREGFESNVLKEIFQPAFGALSLFCTRCHTLEQSGHVKYIVSIMEFKCFCVAESVIVWQRVLDICTLSYSAVLFFNISSNGGGVYHNSSIMYESMTIYC